MGTQGTPLVNTEGRHLTENLNNTRELSRHFCAPRRSVTGCMRSYSSMNMSRKVFFLVIICRRDSSCVCVCVWGGGGGGKGEVGRGNLKEEVV